MKSILAAGSLAFAICLQPQEVAAQGELAPTAVGKLDVSIDTALNWDDPFSLTRQRFETIFRAPENMGGAPLFEGASRSYAGSVVVNHTKDHDLRLTAFGDALVISAFEARWDDDDQAISLHIILTGDEWKAVQPEPIHAMLDKQLGSQGRDSQIKSTGIIPAKRWSKDSYEVMAFEENGEFRIWIFPLRGRSLPTERESVKIAANLDALLNFASLWQWTSDDLSKHYVAKLQDESKQKNPPQFEWVSNARLRARFSRHMFSNVETKLTMFGGSINVEEAILEFVNGKAARATVSFYNRGDSGDIEISEFDRMFKTIGKNLGQVTKVAPQKQLNSANAALEVTSWIWRAPTGIALLEYNEYNTPGKVTKPEFLRLKLAAPDQANWSMGKMATGVQRMELLQRVKKTPEGDVYISGVPMVDQGQKGYCVAASCQRLFEYMRIPCDQHEMAKLVNVDAQSGANVLVMQKSLAKIDSAFSVTFKPLINPEQYYTSSRKRRVSEKQFVSMVKENVDKGVPLLWGLILGEKPEEPPLPGAGQTRGGHMRMVIGYNLAKNQVLFTDSWGAGHELKRMAMLDAYDVTMGLYSMAPRGF